MQQSEQRQNLIVPMGNTKVQVGVENRGRWVRKIRYRDKVRRPVAAVAVVTPQVAGVFSRMPAIPVDRLDI